MGKTSLGVDGLPAGEGDLSGYLDDLGALYRSAATSTEDPSFLQGVGGVLALAAQDAGVVRASKVLGVLDWERTWVEKEAEAQARWKKHADQIAALAKSKKLPPQVAAEQYVSERAFSGITVQSEKLLAR